MIIKPAVGDFRPAVTNLVSKVSIPSAAPVIVKTAGGAIINPTADFKILDTTKNILSGVPKEKFDTVFETVKKTSKKRVLIGLVAELLQEKRGRNNSAKYYHQLSEE